MLNSKSLQPPLFSLSNLSTLSLQSKSLWDSLKMLRISSEILTQLVLIEALSICSKILTQFPYELSGILRQLIFWMMLRNGWSMSLFIKPEVAWLKNKIFKYLNFLWLLWKLKVYFEYLNNSHYFKLLFGFDLKFSIFYRYCIDNELVLYLTS